MEGRAPNSTRHDARVYLPALAVSKAIQLSAGASRSSAVDNVAASAAKQRRRWPSPDGPNARPGARYARQPLTNAVESKMSTGTLGGSSGRLYELGSGQSKSLTSDVTGAAAVIDEVIGKVTAIRGRLGAFQSTTLESNLVSLKDTVVNLQQAESSIRDADFASEAANLTRAQILVQSGTNVLALANQNPQNVLALFR